MILLHDLLELAVQKYADNLAVDAPDHCLSYSELNDRVVRLAVGLYSMGVRCGDRVAILAPNCADYLVAQYACSRLGAIFEVLNTRHVTSELVYAVNNAAASVLIIHEQCQMHLDELLGCETVEFSIGLGDISLTSHNIDDLLSSHNMPVEQRIGDESAPAVLMYTSGTTGRPKGAIQNQQGSVQADKLTAKLLSITEQDKFLAFMPFFHQAGLIRARATLSQGACIVIAEDLATDQIANYMLEKKISITMLVPPYSGALFALCESQNITLPDLRMIIGVAGKRVQKFCKLNQCQSMAVYGQTEVTGLITTIMDEEAWNNPASVGKVVEDMEIQIHGDGGEPVAAGEVGEIMVRSVRCVPGYWNNEAATEELYSNGWMHTGDLGRLDEAGFLYFINRKKELIKTGGENVYPIEVENVIRQHADIVDMTVIGLRDKNWGEAVTAILVTKNGVELDADTIKSFCQGKLAGYKIPKYIFCVDQIPRNHTGKPDKLSLVKRFQ